MRKQMERRVDEVMALVEALFCLFNDLLRIGSKGFQECTDVLLQVTAQN